MSTADAADRAQNEARVEQHCSGKAVLCFACCKDVHGVDIMSRSVCVMIIHDPSCNMILMISSD